MLEIPSTSGPSRLHNSAVACLVVFTLSLILAAAPLSAEQRSAAPPKQQSASQETKTDAEIRITGSPVSITVGDQPHAAQVTDGAPKTSANENANTAINSSIKTATVWIAVFTFLLVVVGMGQGVVYGLTLKEIRSDVAATQESIVLTHRPKIAVRNVVIPGLEVLHRKSSFSQLEQTWNGGPVAAYYHLVNIGQTEARIHHIENQVLVVDQLPMRRPYDDGTVKPPVNIFLAGGASMKYDIPEVSIENADLIKILNGEINVFVIGLIQYFDRQGQSRQTAICRQLDHHSRRFVPIDDPDYEYAD